MRRASSVSRRSSSEWWSGRREAPRAARPCRLAPVSSRPLSTGHWVLPSPARSERLSAAAFPGERPATGSPTSRSCRRRTPGWRAAFAATAGHGRRAHSHTGTAIRRVIAASGTPGLSISDSRTGQRPFARARLFVLAVLAALAHTASAANLPPSRRLPLRLYAGSLPPGRSWLGRRPSPRSAIDLSLGAATPTPESSAGCTRPVSSPADTAFAKS